IDPPHAHVHREVRTAAGMPPTSVVVAAGDHGATIVGRHGMGVSTPSAVAVAAATCGLAREVHIANGGMLLTGAMSVMRATGRFSTMTVLGVGMIAEGAVPNVHII